MIVSSGDEYIIMIEEDNEDFFTWKVSYLSKTIGGLKKIMMVDKFIAR